MNPSRPFILRPVATSLLMLAILLAGVIAYRILPISALPQVDYPTIQVVTLYPGASPDVTTSSITAPLERQFGQMPGLKQMSSTSSAGASVITLQFDLALSLDIAEQEVQAAINASGSFLPADLPTPPIYNKVNPADTPIMTLALASKTDANDQLKSADEYKSMIIAYRNGSPVRLTDVADIIDGAENTRLAAWANQQPAIIVNIQRQPGANVIEVVDRIKQLLPQLQAGLPAAVDVTMLTDRTITIRASVHDVQFELFLAIALVVMVIFLFLRSLSATVIPSVAVPLSLVGTFGVMYLAGFSINNLTLMALTIATGFVVDDAIVVIENIARYIEKGEKPLDAALKGTEQIAFTIISLTVSLIAVLIPLLFMGDVVGRLFREFAITLAITILISAVVSLTLTPMLSARWLKPAGEEHQGRIARKSQAAFERVERKYEKGLGWVLEHQALTLMVGVGTLVLTALLYLIIPKGLFPTQDTGQLQARTEVEQSVSYDRMAGLQQDAAKAIL